MFPMNMVRLCIDKYGVDIAGRVYSKLSPEPLIFDGCGEMLLRMDDMFEKSGYPQSFQEKRSFRKEDRRGGRRNLPEDLLADEELEKQSGDCGTFEILVQSRMRTGWQGLLMHTDRTLITRFRSEIELLECLRSEIEKMATNIRK